MIIGISGLIGSGKSTVAKYLIEKYNFKQESFASSLKDSISIIFNWDRNLLEGQTDESRIWRDQVDTWWANRLNIPDLTPRWILQNIGTNVMREYFHDNIWIASLENKLRNTKDNIVISDCRFINEIDAIRTQNAKIIRIKRGGDPEHYCVKNTIKETHEVLKNMGIHLGEYEWVGTNFDYILENDTIESLHSKIDIMMEKFRQ